MTIVFLHECGHILAAYSSGGQVLDSSIFGTSGHVLAEGGSHVFILWAGYGFAILITSILMGICIQQHSRATPVIGLLWVLALIDPVSDAVSASQALNDIHLLTERSGFTTPFLIVSWMIVGASSCITTYFVRGFIVKRGSAEPSEAPPQ